MAAFIDEDMNIHHINTFDSNASIETVECLAVIPNFFCRKWKTFVMYWWFVYLMFWTSVLGVAVCTSLTVVVECEDASLLSCFQGFEFWALSCLLTWEHSTSGLWVVCKSFLVLVWLPCPSSTFSGSTGCPKFCGGFSLVLHGLRNTKFTGFVFAGIIGLGFAIGEPSLEVASWPLFDMALLSDRIRKKITEMTAREHREIHDVEQTKKVNPFIFRETSFGQNVSELVFGVNVFHLDLRFQVNSVEQQIKRNSVGSGCVSHCWTSSSDTHLDDSFIVFKNFQLRLTLRRVCVGGYVIHIWQLLNLSLSLFSWWMVSCRAQVSFG